MNRLHAAAAFAAMACGMAAAQAPPELDDQLHLRLPCLDEECTDVAVPLDVMRALQLNAALYAAANRQLKEDLEKMRAIKGCARTQVTEPSKLTKPAPLKRDSGS